jgi:chromosome segregation ATPase
MKQQEDEFDQERDNWQRTKVELGKLFEAERNEKETLLHEVEQREDELQMLRERTEIAIKELADAKMRASHAEEEAARAKKEAETAWKHAEKSSSSMANPSSPGSTNVQAEVEKVARELHTLYKAKHESKVTALKKSYEARWEKKVTALQSELDAEKRKREELETQMNEKDDKEMSLAAPAVNPEEIAALKEELERLTEELESERREKGELVGAVEELLSIQAQASAGIEQVSEERVEKVSKRVARVSGVGFGGSSGLKGGIERMGSVGREKK